ncbi:hypothetical protein FPHYL_7521 [Fusarium phyllophilum]|uniref:Uncharacterized protein n=1 Tax=Fusarium phyllophilum TaxID=47803 RepID=A0A8H5JRF2_9HYPO|nr:hypothetical protein FPHYL_7521 [Fusarium phyllophilum]
MACFIPFFRRCLRRRRAGSSLTGSTVIDRPSSERTLGSGRGQPEGQESDEPPQEIELPNQDADVQSDAPQDGPQQGTNITSFPSFPGSPVDNPSIDVPRQGAPQHGNHQQGSEIGSHSTATGQFPPYRDPMQGNQGTSSSSDGPSDTQTHAAQNSMDSQRNQEPNTSQGERDVLDHMTLLN